MTKLLALAASTRPESLNKKLLALAVSVAEAAGAHVTTLDYAAMEVGYVHHETRTLPPAMVTLADALLAHDGLLLATPEYNWSIPGGLKNVIDWLSMDGRAPLRGRTALLMSTSTGMRGGVSGLLHTRVPLEALGMWVYPQVIAVGKAVETLGAGRLNTDKDQLHLTTSVTKFVATTKSLATHVTR